jgi:hypothetical protein
MAALVEQIVAIIRKPAAISADPRASLRERFQLGCDDRVTEPDAGLAEARQAQ